MSTLWRNSRQHAVDDCRHYDTLRDNTLKKYKALGSTADRKLSDLITYSFYKPPDTWNKETRVKCIGIAKIFISTMYTTQDKLKLIRINKQKEQEAFLMSDQSDQSEQYEHDTL